MIIWTSMGTNRVEINRMISRLAVMIAVSVLVEQKQVISLWRHSSDPWHGARFVTALGTSLQTNGKLDL